MADFRTIDELDVAGKRVLVRADLNVPVKDGRVTDTTRLDRLAPTVKELAAKRARVILLSHFGRPKGGPDAVNSLRQLVEPLGRALGGMTVRFAPDCIRPEAERIASSLRR